MKRLFAAILALCLLALPACGTEPAETTPVSTTPTPTFPICTTPVPSTPVVTTPTPTTPAPTTPVASGDEKVYSNATIEDDFAEDEVLVVLTHTASLAKFDYTVEDFADVGCVEVKNLTSYTTERVRNAVGKMASLDSETRRLVQNYNAIWSIKLAEPGKQNVLDAIAILMERDDVKSATPNMRISLEPVKPEITPLTDAQMAEINAAWLEEKGYPAKWFDENEIITRHFGLRYYGTYGGYQILFAPGTKASGHEIYFDNILLNYETEFALYAYHSGELFSAQALYESGALNSEDITAIARYHAATELAIANRFDLDNPYDRTSPEFPALEPLPEETVEAFCNALEITKEDYLDMHFAYCGTYNGYVVMVNPTNSDGFDYRIIGGQFFDLGSTWFFTVYQEGKEPLTLETAFNYNIVTAEDVEKIEYYARTLLGY